LLAGSLVVLECNTGGAWDNAKQYYEKLGLKGAPEHKALEPLVEHFDQADGNHCTGVRSCFPWRQRRRLPHQAVNQPTQTNGSYWHSAFALGCDKKLLSMSK
jgi:hypothetical protein